MMASEGNDANDGGGRAPPPPLRRGRARQRAHKPPRVWPNFLVGVRVRSAQLGACVEVLQAAIRAELPALSPCLVDARTLHVTLCVVHLADNRAVEAAAEVLRYETNKFLEQSEDPLTLDFSSWGFFGRHDVLFAAPTRSIDWLGTLAEALHGAFQRLGVTTESFRLPYAPHATVWKTSKARQLINTLNASRPPHATVQDDLARLVEAYDPPSGVDFPERVSLLHMRERGHDGASLSSPAEKPAT